MENLIQTFTSFNTDYLFVFLLALFFSLEQFMEKGSAIKQNSIHLFHNIILQKVYIVLNIATAAIFVFFFDWIVTHNIGLFNQIKMPYITKIFFGILAIDFVGYWAHRLNHKWPVFWRLHRVHHSDTKMDSSTSFRAHPLDIVLDNAAVIFAGIVFGLDINIIVLRWIIYMPLFVAHHTSYMFPKWTDTFFGKMFVTPNLHKIHHHQNQEYTDSNYGNVFIFWDKLFGTYKELPVAAIKYGLIEFEESKKQTFWYLLKSPFIHIKSSNIPNKNS